MVYDRERSLAGGRRARHGFGPHPGDSSFLAIGDNGCIPPPAVTIASKPTEGVTMAAMKPRTGDGPMEVTKEGRGYVMRVPLEGGGRLVVELNGAEAKELGEKLLAVFG